MSISAVWYTSNMNWFLLTIVSVFVASFASILQRVLMKGDKSNPYSYAIVFHFLLGILNLIVALFYGFEFLPLNGSLIYILLSAALWGACTVFLFKALQLLESSEVTILSSFGVVVTIIASIIFLHESFNLQKILGTIIIVASILLVTKFKAKIKFNNGVIYALMMTLFAGLAFVVDSFNVQQYDVISYNTITNFLIGFILLLFYPKALRSYKHFIQPDFFKKMLPLGIFSTIQAIAYLSALSYGQNTSQVSAIRQSQIIVTVLLAIIFLNERDNLWRKFIAAVLVTIGVILVK